MLLKVKLKKKFEIKKSNQSKTLLTTVPIDSTRTKKSDKSLSLKLVKEFVNHCTKLIEIFQKSELNLVSEVKITPTIFNLEFEKRLGEILRWRPNS